MVEHHGLHRDGPDAGYWLAFAALSVTDLYFVFAKHYLPMVDLPGHTAQLALILRSVGGEPLPPGFEWNLVTPQTAARALASGRFGVRVLVRLLLAPATRSAGPLALFVSALLLFLFCPAVAGGISHLNWRLSFWVFLGFFALMSPMGSGRRARMARATTGSSCAWRWAGSAGN